jgi:glyoxylase-like metal-dependent hydrolase (beta-lactamase superfamily II)
LIFCCRASAQLATRTIHVGETSAKSQVPPVAAQGRFLAPQAVSAIDINPDGQVVTVGTMAFSHDANVWQLTGDGAVVAKSYFAPWAPMQVATLIDGQAMAVGLAYSRITSPEPTLWLGPVQDLMVPTPKEELCWADSSDGQYARLRPGSGDWQRGWMASSFGELFVHGPEWIFKPPDLLLDAQGHPHTLSEPTNFPPKGRAMRMASSLDGRRLVFGWLGATGRAQADLPANPNALSLWSLKPNRALWAAQWVMGAPASPLPNPAADFAELSRRFRLAAEVEPGHVTAAVALNGDGSRVAAVEYVLWFWLRNGPAIGKWDPPIHVLNFMPKQRGRLRVFDGNGQEILSELLPEPGMFEVGFGAESNDLWCWPAAWFARGMAGAVWLPVDAPARTIYHIIPASREALALALPDAVAHCAISPKNGRALVSCWDGQIYLVETAGKVLAKLDAGGPARLAWSRDGSFAVAGTASGRLLRIEQSGKAVWDRLIPAAAPLGLDQPPPPVVAGLPVYQGGRIPQAEHAYVGDIWIIKNGNRAVLVDAGGISGFSMTQARLRALAIEEVSHVLHTHSHGDHCGGAYLWHSAGAKIVAARPAALALTWLMPMLTDYGIFPPRPLDLPLPLNQVGDQTDTELEGLKIRALFVPGHSFDQTVYMMELSGKRVTFTGDLGFENQDILDRCWGDANKARAVVQAVRDKLLPWRPEIVFTGHGVRTNGMEFLTALVRHTDESLARALPSDQGRAN